MHRFLRESFLTILLLIIALPVMASPPTKNSSSLATDSLSGKGFETLHTFSRILHDVLQYHAEPPEESKLIEGAIRGLFDSLDPHSAYLPPHVYRALRDETDGHFGGIGIEVVLRNGWLTIIAPIDGTPGADAGLKSGDRIVKIDGKSSKQMSISEAISKLRGRPGSKVVLTLTRRGKGLPFDVAVRRATINVPSVRAELLEPGYGYVRITSFREQTAHDLSQHLHDLSKLAPLKGLVLDMRNNPGGLLDQAVAVSDLFLHKGLIVSTVSRGKEIERHEAHSLNTQADYPIAILVNGGSASASEIVTGALQDHKRAVVFGSQTFGKGSVQSLIEFEDGSALKLTIARYYTPSKRSIQANGIAPDFVVPEEPDAKAKVLVSERSLTGHLKSRHSRHNRSGRAINPKIAMPAGETDYQRIVALEYLKSGQVTRMSKLSF